MKPPMVTHYRAQGVAHDGTPFDELRPFTQAQAGWLGRGLIVGPDGIPMDAAVSLIRQWTAAASWYSGPTYSLPGDSPAQTLPTP